MFTIVSWYTKQTPYESVINTYLIPSLIKLNLPYCVYPMDSLNNWQRNTNLKPQIIEEAFSDTDNDLLVIDADAIVHCYPKLFQEIPQEYDCAMFWLNWNEFYRNGSDKNELCSGTLYFRNRSICKELIERWKKEASKSYLPDQRVLEEVLKEFPDLKIYKLPYEYCWINSLPGNRPTYVERPKQVVVEHFQVSRKLKRKV